MLLPKVAWVINYTPRLMIKIVASLMIIIYDCNRFVVQAIHLSGATILSIMTLSAIILNVIILNAIMLNVIMLSVIMLSAIMLNVTFYSFLCRTSLC
jgi:hypothetical protein